jgi:hypothetical protein
MRVHKQCPLIRIEKSRGTIWNDSGCPLGLSATCGGPTTPGSTTAVCSARHWLSASSGVAVQAPDVTLGLRCPWPCNVIAGPKLNHRSLGGCGMVTVCHRSDRHTNGMLASGGWVITSDRVDAHGVPGCATTGSATATAELATSSASAIPTAADRTSLDLRHVSPHQHDVVLIPQRQVPVQVSAGPRDPR